MKPRYVHAGDPRGRSGIIRSRRPSAAKEAPAYEPATPKAGRQCAAVVKYLKRMGGCASEREITDATGIHGGNISCVLGVLFELGVVRPIGRDCYRLTKDGGAK